MQEPQDIALHRGEAGRSQTPYSQLKTIAQQTRRKRLYQKTLFMRHTLIKLGWTAGVRFSGALGIS